MALSINPFSHLRAQVKSSLEREAKLTPNERRQHQWQFFSTVNGVTYIVGKGGANTMFYMIGENGERQLCSPEAMLAIISSWANSKFAMYAVCKKPSAYTHGPFVSEKEALDVTDAPKGSFIVGLTPDNKVIRLYKLKSGLMQDEWVPFKPKKK